VLTKTSFSILFFCLAGAITQAQSRDDARWIEQARSTPVGQLEAGFPSERFDQWFANLVKPSETMYEVHECHETLPSGRESQQRLLCVIASVKPPYAGWRPWVQVLLSVGVLPPSSKKGKPVAVTPIPCRFIVAIKEESDPRITLPVRYFSKLKDVEKGAPGYKGAAR
jgi:hypothetical protein